MKSKCFYNKVNLGNNDAERCPCDLITANHDSPAQPFLMVTVTFSLHSAVRSAIPRVKQILGAFHIEIYWTKSEQFHKSTEATSLCSF